MKNRLKIIKKKNSGRDFSGKVVVRHQGGQHKRFYRIIDFKRNKFGISGKIAAIEYDPNRTCDIALVQYTDGDKRYILCPEGLKLNDTVISGPNSEIKIGNALPLSEIPVGTVIHNVELTSGKGGQIARGSGTATTVQAKEGDFAHLKLPSGEIRKVRIKNYATIGNVGNAEWKNEVIGKAGRKRNMGIRPTVRGVAQNPRSHPHGGGEGRSGIGMPTPKTYAGRPAVGNTRKKNKHSNKYIMQRRKK
ncbi:MAG: 50S ribosomal protein L2 [Candidatus Levybacteria bacterium CG_4_9_14_3_um_filter_35_16]|nr:MAG: 50S ribosomal protein L2 [Candidatus Levybacteria bacterium CG22_combo_CG10-13_8_21_14_all_35_11]PJA91456.1 MAG: 50S ribosomal protein L2 [Candidatus Levybacteria bacterium CG_4_9_14_3_um_filter_35_16]PJC54774.1 MAG: 50S ribosomal protein L2 [Candidatus Levybacteria bacterium CG_4_9_14_0_2_um_filter_35_21]